MCKVSNKLKLCSCKVSNIKTLKDYWILNRPTDTNECIMGEAILPADIGEQAERYNITALRKLLNDGNCFDIEIQHQENDILELHFTYKAKSNKRIQMPDSGGYLAYAFVHKNGKWKKTSYDPFGANLNSIQGGKISEPFK